MILSDIPYFVRCYWRRVLAEYASLQQFKPTIGDGVDYQSFDMIGTGTSYICSLLSVFTDSETSLSDLETSPLVTGKGAREAAPLSFRARGWGKAEGG